MTVIGFAEINKLRGAKRRSNPEMLTLKQIIGLKINVKNLSFDVATRSGAWVKKTV